MDIIFGFATENWFFLDSPEIFSQTQKCRNSLMKNWKKLLGEGKFLEMSAMAKPAMVIRFADPSQDYTDTHIRAMAIFAVDFSNRCLILLLRPERSANMKLDR